MRLHPEAQQKGYRLRSVETTGSTNQDAFFAAEAGDVGGLWILAGEQSSGRGRRGHNWFSPQGNFSASLLLPLSLSIDASSLPHLGFVTALSVLDALCHIHPDLQTRLTLKWPNDLLLDGAKLAGFLVEAQDRPVKARVIGIGINLCAHPSSTPYPATSLKRQGKVSSVEQVLFELSRILPLRLEQWHEQGFASIRSDWLKSAHGLGQPIRTHQGNRNISGLFEGLSEQGHLLLRTADDHVHTIYAGEIFNDMSECV